MEELTAWKFHRGPPENAGTRSPERPAKQIPVRFQNERPADGTNAAAKVRGLRHVPLCSRTGYISCTIGGRVGLTALTALHESEIGTSRHFIGLRVLNAMGHSGRRRTWGRLDPVAIDPYATSAPSWPSPRRANKDPARPWRIICKRHFVATISARRHSARLIFPEVRSLEAACDGGISLV